MLALHGVVGWLLVVSSSRSTAPPASARFSVFVVPQNALAPPPKRVDREPDAPRETAKRVLAAPAPRAAFAPLTLPGPAAGEGADVAATAADPAASEPQAGPLNLNLPRARDGPRASARAPVGNALDGSRSRGFGERMARALGTDRTLVEEPLNGDSVRLRQGSDCVVVSRSRESQLDPFNQSVNPSARGVTPCR